MSKKFFSLIFIVTAMYLISLISGTQDIYPLEDKKKAGGKPEERIIIAHTEIFGKLERPQVVFDHGKHSDALKKEGCETCHPANKEEGLIFEYPFKQVMKDKESMMNLYHEKCIDCHKKRIKEKKKAGPLTCGECHRKELESIKIKYPIFEFDFYYHRKHVKKLKNDCILCHHIYDEDDEELVYEEGTEQSCYYCHETRKKKGPLLEVEARVIDKKGLTIKKVSHLRCLNCHIDRNKRGLKAGPLVCSKCHTGKYKTVAELAKITRPDREQPEKTLINIEDARMKRVLFDHKSHEKKTKTCRGCHHETLNACKKCHGLSGSPDGKWVNLSSAYHDALSEKSCTGCHGIKKSEKGCTGCHHHLQEIDYQAIGEKKAICSLCHRGKKEALVGSPSISVYEIYTQKIHKKIKIKTLEREYEPAIFPHLKVIKKLVQISNGSKMATYFHRNLQTICEGCHHNRHLEAEAKKNTPPSCRNCHPISFDPQNINKPRLLAAYHRRCIGCHEKMELKPMECKDCHKEKAVRTAKGG
ncbi:MAG: sulfate respiration complex hexadecaheme cytochrome HmcA [Nitrospirota bacterium]